MKGDLLKAAEPATTQLVYDDFSSGPRDCLITEARLVHTDAGVDLYLWLEGYERPWKVPKGMQRFIIACWTDDHEELAGHRFRLYGEPNVEYGGKKVGGIRISHMDTITTAFTGKLTVKRGQKIPYTIEPLPPALSDTDITDCADIQTLRDMWDKATDEQKTLIRTRASQLEQLGQKVGQQEETQGGYDGHDSV